MENSFIAICKSSLNVDQYGCKCEFPENFWWNPKLNFTKFLQLFARCTKKSIYGFVQIKFYYGPIILLKERRTAQQVLVKVFHIQSKNTWRTVYGTHGKVNLKPCVNQASMGWI